MPDDEKADEEDLRAHIREAVFTRPDVPAFDEYNIEDAMDFLSQCDGFRAIPTGLIEDELRTVARVATVIDLGPEGGR